MLGTKLATAGAAVALTVLALRATDVVAGDHHEAPGAEADPAADIADLYAWHTGAGGNLILGLSWGGYALRGDPATYDPDVLYGLHIDTNADNTPDHDIYARFGQDGDGNWGVQVENLPGTMAPVSGAVESNIEGEGGTKVFAGLRDDPFFFDSEGFKTTLMTGTLSFDNTRDFALFQNATVLVVEMPIMSLSGGGSTPFKVWATTSRKG